MALWLVEPFRPHLVHLHLSLRTEMTALRRFAAKQIEICELGWALRSL